MFAAYKKFWTHYADFSSRSSRSDYWWVVLCHVIVTAPLFIIFWASAFGSILSAAVQDSTYGYESDPSAILAGAGFAVIFIFILILYALATFVPNLAIIVRRLRDAGYHWAFLFLYVGPFLLSFIPVLNIIAGIVSLPCSIALIVLLCQGSKPEMVGNSYGQQYGQQNFQGQQFGQQPYNQGLNYEKQPQQGGFQGQQFGQQPQQGGFQGQQFGQQPQQPVSEQSQAVEQAEPVQNPFTAETPEQSTPQDFGTQAPVQDNPFVSSVQEEQASTPAENSVDDATENQE